jgi:hypothetical protein
VLGLRRAPRTCQPPTLGDAVGNDSNSKSHLSCLRQSAGDSTGPKVRVAPDVLAEFGIEDYVGKLKASARTQDPPNLGERSLLLGD